MKSKFFTAILVATLTFALVACGDSGEDSTSTADNAESTEADTKETEEPKEEEKTEFAVGETATQGDVSITLVTSSESAGSDFIVPDEGNTFLLLEFQIENNSDKDVTISSLVNFEAYCDDTVVNQDIMGLQAPEAEGKEQLDGTIAPGKNMIGVIAYQVPTDYSSFEVSVAPDFWSSSDMTFIISK